MWGEMGVGVKVEGDVEGDVEGGYVCLLVVVWLYQWGVGEGWNVVVGQVGWFVYGVMFVLIQLCRVFQVCVVCLGVKLQCVVV